MKQLNVKQKIFCSIILGLFCSMVSFAQGAYEITGKVTSDDGMALPGVNVLVVGTPNGTATDFDGNYKITASNGESLEFNYIGFATQTIAITGQKTINITMAQDAESLADVVVVGYGTRKKSDITGAVSSVKSEELTAFPVLNAEQALQGRAAGVVVQSNNGGEPGAPISIDIRGNTSILASSRPLIVVDGFVGATMPQAGDIQSIEVLKDASATAIYGSRGSNGVVMVTTKKGKKGKMSVEINSNYSVQTTSNKLDLLNANDFADYQNTVRENVAITQSIDEGSTVTPVEYVQGDFDTDWQDLIYRTGNTSNHQMSFSGGTEKINYYASGTYFKQDGILVNSGFERISFLANIDAQISEKLKLGVNLVSNFGKKKGVATQSDGSVTVGSDDVVSLAMRFAPDKGIYNDDGTFSTNDLIGDEVDNPYAVATQRDDDTDIENMRANFYLDYELLKGLNFKTTFGLSSDNQTRGRYAPRTLEVTAGGVDGRAIIEEDKDRSILSENYLTYKKEIGKGDLTLLGGYSYQKTTDTGFYSEGTGTISDSFSYYGLWTATNLINSSAGNTYETVQEIQSVFGRLNFDYDDKYLITATVRRDGASNFAENEKYATFPSAAIGWKVSNEKFLENVDAISNLKLRASYGVTGNPSISPYQSLASLQSIYASVDGVTVNALSPNQSANPNLKWESSYQQNYGIDIGLLNNAISLSVDYYNIDTEDVIMVNQSAADFLGFLNPNVFVNAGEVNNEGFEITLNTRNISNENFSWTTDFVFSKNKNTVVSLIGGVDFLSNGAPSYFSVDNNSLLREGEEAGLFFGLDYAGVYQGGTLPEGTAAFANAAPGDPLFIDVDGNGEIDTDDRKIIGNPNPDFTWGITNNFSYKNIDLNIFFQGSQGNDIFNMTNVQLNNGDANTTYDYFNSAWTPDNTSTNQPRVGNNSSREISSRFVEDGSYIRLKNIAIGYTIDSNFLDSLSIENIRISASAQNLFTITDYSGLDPEVNYFGATGGSGSPSNAAQNNVRGFDFGNYPTLRSFTFGVNVKF